MRLSQSISICYKLPHVTAHVTLHVTVKLLYFSMYFHMLPNVTVTFYKKYTYFFVKSGSNMWQHMRILTKCDISKVTCTVTCAVTCGNMR